MNNEQQAARDAAWEQWGMPFHIKANEAAAKCGFYAGFDAGYSARDAEDAWVAVSDRLPTIKGKYLLTWKSVQDDAFFVTQEFCDTVRFGSFGITVANPIAWKPLPQPYQPTEGE